MSDSHGARRGLGAWWNALSIRSRERVLLGSLVGVALAARDALLLAFAAGLLTTIEIRAFTPPAAGAAQPS